MKSFAVVLAALLGGAVAGAAHSTTTEVEFRHKEIQATARAVERVNSVLLTKYQASM